MGVMQRGALLAIASVDGIEGRAARFEAVFTAHSGVIYAYARRRVTKEEAEDVVSEAFLVAWRRLDDLPAEPVPWLIGVARNVLANRRRADNRRAALGERLRRTSARPAPAATSYRPSRSRSSPDDGYPGKCGTALDSTPIMDSLGPEGRPPPSRAPTDRRRRPR